VIAGGAGVIVGRDLRARSRVEGGPGGPAAGVPKSLVIIVVTRMIVQAWHFGDALGIFSGCSRWHSLEHTWDVSGRFFETYSITQS
jgi:hypothetical protein